MNEISPQELKTRLAGPDRPLLLDVRHDWETGGLDLWARTVDPTMPRY